MHQCWPPRAVRRVPSDQPPKQRLGTESGGRKKVLAPGSSLHSCTSSRPALSCSMLQCARESACQYDCILVPVRQELCVLLKDMLPVVLMSCLASSSAQHDLFRLWALLVDVAVCSTEYSPDKRSNRTCLHSYKRPPHGGRTGGYSSFHTSLHLHLSGAHVLLLA